MDCIPAEIRMIELLLHFAAIYIRIIMMHRLLSLRAEQSILMDREQLL